MIDIKNFMEKFYTIFPKLKNKINVIIMDGSKLSDDMIENNYHGYNIRLSKETINDEENENLGLFILAHELSHIIFYHKCGNASCAKFKDDLHFEVAADTYSLRLLYILGYDPKLIITAMDQLAWEEYDMCCNIDNHEWIYGGESHPSYVARLRITLYYYDNQLYKDDQYYTVDYNKKIFNKFIGGGIDNDKLNEIFNWYTNEYDIENDFNF